MQELSVRPRLLGEPAVTRTRTKRGVRVKVPEEQSPVFHVPGRRGGWFVSLLWGFGENVEVSWKDLCDLLAMRDGSVVVARRLTASETHLLERSRADCDRELHARIVHDESARWRRLR